MQSGFFLCSPPLLIVQRFAHDRQPNKTKLWIDLYHFSEDLGIELDAKVIIHLQNCVVLLLCCSWTCFMS